MTIKPIDGESKRLRETHERELILKKVVIRGQGQPKKGKP